MMPTSKTTLPNFRIPAKWLSIIVFALVAYGLCQPFVNRKLGWSWPSLSSVMGLDEKKPKTEADTNKDQDGQKGTTSRKTAKPAKPAESTDPELSASPNDSKLLYGFLKDLGREDYLSPAGLHYTRGSEQGHRLKHIERHLEDIPDRDGRHGVFDGDMAQVVRWIDDAYTRAKQGSQGTKREGGELERTIYEASFSKPIGYLGGRDGRKQKNPPANRIRIVVDDQDRVITAFPF